MKVIEKEVARRNLPLQQRVKKELMEASNTKQVSDKEVYEKVMEINKKNCSANFVSTSRERREFILRNPTNVPEVGKYYPNMKAVSKEMPNAKFDVKDYSKQAK